MIDATETDEPPTHEQVAAAIVDRDLAKEDEVASEVAKLLARATQAYRDAVAELSGAGDEDVLEASRRVEMLAAAVPAVEIAADANEAWIAAAARLLLRYRSEAERRTRYHQRAMQRIARDLEIAERALTPALRAWAEANPPRRGRSVRVDGARLRFKRLPPKLEVRGGAVEAIEQRFGAFDAVERGLLRHEVKVGKRALKELLKEQPELEDELDGVQVLPATDGFYVDEG